MEKEILISEINEAFKDVELDGGIGIGEANALDDHRDEKFRAECKKNDEKHRWSTIPSSILNQYYCSLSYFDAKGMKFHLPAFMIAVIKDEYRFDIDFTLTNISDDYSKSRFALFTKKQREAVKLFLEYILKIRDLGFEETDIRTAIKNYWSL